MESEMDMDESGSVQLSQSATDVRVHIGLPEGEIELELREATREPDAGITMEAEYTDVPRCPGIVSTPVLMSSEGVQQTPRTGPSDEETQKTPVGTTESFTVQRALVTNPAESQQMLREIRNAQLLHEELMRIDPTLATASSFVSTVCGGRVSKENTEKSKDGGAKKSPVVNSVISDVVKPVMSAGVIEKQRVTRILVAKTMLGEELANNEPSPASLAVLRKAAFGMETPESEPTNPETATESTTPKATDEMAVGTSSESLPQPMATDSSVEPVLISDELSEVEVSDDAAMSIGDSDNEEGISEDYSRTGSSSGGKSTTSRVSHKRPADESPEREIKETSR